MSRSLLTSIAVAFALVACGPGPTGEPKTEAKPKAAAVATCPPSAPAPDAAPGKLDTVAGKRIAKICIYGVDGDARGAAQKALRSSEGEPLDLEKVREDIAGLLKSGVVEDTTISAIPSGDSVVVVYALKERPRIAEVVFDGAQVFEKEGLTGKIGLEKQRPLVMSEVYDLKTAMREEYGRRGYRSVKVESKVEPAGPNLVRLKFSVVEGPQWKLGKVTFKGASKVPAADLKKAAALEEGAAFDEEKVDRAALELQALYFDRGMINVRVERAVSEPDKDVLAERGQKVEILPRTDVDAKTKTLAITLDVEAAGQ